MCERNRVSKVDDNEIMVALCFKDIVYFYFGIADSVFVKNGKVTRYDGNNSV